MSQGRQRQFQFWAEWEKKLRKIERKQYRTLIENRAFFRQCNEVWAPHTGSYTGADLAGWIIDAYVAYTGAWIRKMAEEPDGSRKYSLVILLRDVANHAQHITRSRFESLYLSKDNRTATDHLRRLWIDMADRDFDVYAGDGISAMTRSVVEQDIAEITAVVAPVKALVDKVIAHTDKKPPVAPCTFGAIMTAIDVLESKFRRYYMLILGRQPTIFETIDVADDLRKIWPNDAPAPSPGSWHAAAAVVTSATT